MTRGGYGYLDALLEEWGDWIGQHEEYSGFPPDTIIWKMIRWLTAPRGRQGHRILCAEMPHRLFQANVTVKRLERHQQDILRIRYVHTQRLDGRPWTNRERAAALGMRKADFCLQLREARVAFKRLHIARVEEIALPH